MAKLIEKIQIPACYRTVSTVCPTAINLYDEYVEVEGPRAATYFYKDFTGISTQNASIFCAYASIIFLNPVSADSTWKNDMPVLTDRNRVLLCGGTFKYKGVNLYTAALAEKIRQALVAYKANPTEHKPLDTVNELKRYKELLDSGIITQEEFEAKKKQLLAL